MSANRNQKGFILNTLNTTVLLSPTWQLINASVTFRLERETEFIVNAHHDRDGSDLMILPLTLGSVRGGGVSALRSSLVARGLIEPPPRR